MSVSGAATGVKRLALTREHALLLVFCLVWSSAFSAAKIAIADCPPLILLGFRFVLAGVAMLACAWAMRAEWRLSLRDVLTLAAIGLLNNALYLGLSFSGMKTVSSGFAAILISSNPVLTAVLASPLLGEKLTARKIIGLFLGLAGVAFVLRTRIGGGHEDPAGVVLVLAGLVALVLGTLAYKRFAPADKSSGGLWIGSGIQCLSGGLSLLPVALLVEPISAVHLTPGLIGSFLYLVFGVSIVGYLLWFRLLQRMSAGGASALHFLMPPLGLLFGWAILGEPVPPLDLIGIVPIAIGIRLATQDR